jgi:hypothetical protein
MSGDRPRPRLFLAGPGSSIVGALAALVGASAAFTVEPDMFLRRREAEQASPKGRYGGRRGGRRGRAWYKGSAMAKRATRRGGNPAKSGLAGPPVVHTPRKEPRRRFPIRLGAWL